MAAMTYMTIKVPLCPIEAVDLLPKVGSQVEIVGCNPLFCA